MSIHTFPKMRESHMQIIKAYFVNVYHHIILINCRYLDKSVSIKIMEIFFSLFPADLFILSPTA